MSKVKIIDKRSEDSIISERELLSKIKHPFIVNMYFAFQDFQNLYLVMDLLTGGDLRYHLSKNKKFSENQTKFFLSNILLSLEYIHNKNIIHRDIKPENLVLDKNGYVRLTDFGIAKINEIDNSNETSGTPGYMAPEVILIKNHSFSCDFFALGVIGYEFMLGYRPYIGRSRKEIKELIINKQAKILINEIPDGWSLDAMDFINKLLQRKPHKRLGYFNGVKEIKSHEWFKNVNWDLVEKKCLNAPFVPCKNKENYDKKYCEGGENIGDTTFERYQEYLDDSIFPKVFKHYTYVNISYIENSLYGNKSLKNKNDKDCNVGNNNNNEQQKILMSYNKKIINKGNNNKLNNNNENINVKIKENNENNIDKNKVIQKNNLNKTSNNNINNLHLVLNKDNGSGKSLDNPSNNNNENINSGANSNNSKNIINNNYHVINFNINNNNNNNTKNKNNLANNLHPYYRLIKKGQQGVDVRTLKQLLNNKFTMNLTKKKHLSAEQKNKKEILNRNSNQSKSKNKSKSKKNSCDNKNKFNKKPTNKKIITKKGIVSKKALINKSSSMKILGVTKNYTTVIKNSNNNNESKKIGNCNEKNVDVKNNENNSILHHINKLEIEFKKNIEIKYKNLNKNNKLIFTDNNNKISTKNTNNVNNIKPINTNIDINNNKNKEKINKTKNDTFQNIIFGNKIVTEAIRVKSANTKHNNNYIKNKTNKIINPSSNINTKYINNLINRNNPLNKNNESKKNKDISIKNITNNDNNKINNIISNNNCGNRPNVIYSSNTKENTQFWSFNTINAHSRKNTNSYKSNQRKKSATNNNVNSEKVLIFNDDKNQGINNINIINNVNIKKRNENIFNTKNNNNNSTLTPDHDYDKDIMIKDKFGNLKIDVCKSTNMIEMNKTMQKNKNVSEKI